MFSFFENTLQLKLEARSQVRTLGTRLLKLHSNLVTLVRLSVGRIAIEKEKKYGIQIIIIKY